MKVGDLVKYRNPFPDYPQAMLVIEKGVYVGRCDIKIMWGDGHIQATKSGKLEVINESR